MSRYLYVRCEHHPKGVNVAPVSFAHEYVYADDEEEAYIVGRETFADKPSKVARDHKYRLLNDYVVKLGAK